MSLAYLRARYPAAFAALQHSAAVFGPTHNHNAVNQQPMNPAEAIAWLNDHDSTNRNHNPRPPQPMNFHDLSDAIDRLRSNPQCHPSTKVELEVEHEIAIHHSTGASEIEHSSTSDPLVTISIAGGAIKLSSARCEPAVAR